MRTNLVAIEIEFLTADYVDSTNETNLADDI